MTNKRQYRTAKAQAENLRNALEWMKRDCPRGPLFLAYLRWKAQFDAIKSELQKLERAIGRG